VQKSNEKKIVYCLLTFLSKTTYNSEGRPKETVEMYILGPLFSSVIRTKRT